MSLICIAAARTFAIADRRRSHGARQLYDRQRSLCEIGFGCRVGQVANTSLETTRSKRSPASAAPAALEMTSGSASLNHSRVGTNARSRSWKLTSVVSRWLAVDGYVRGHGETSRCPKADSVQPEPDHRLPRPRQARDRDRARYRLTITREDCRRSSATIRQPRPSGLRRDGQRLARWRVAARGQQRPPGNCAPPVARRTCC
jgi:hypothetical protein